MPGLYGNIDFAKPPDEKLLAKLVKWIVGHDTVLYEHSEPNVALGFKSLDIVDFKPQPRRDEALGLTLFFWGEAYEEGSTLAKIAERIVACCQSGKVEQLADLNGLYSFTLWDSSQERLTLACDVYATRPLFYHAAGDSLIFAPSPFALAAALRVKEIDPAALSGFLSFALIPGNASWFKGIKRLRAGQYLTFDRQGLKVDHYFHPQYKRITMSLRVATNGLTERLSTALHRIPTERTALSLSGGGDSRLLLAIAEQEGVHLPTFTFGGVESEDLRLAALVATAANTEHTSLRIGADYLTDSLRGAVLNTHGHVAAINFHGYSTRASVKRIADICLSGLPGNNQVGYLSFTQRLFKKVKERPRFRDHLCRWLGTGFQPSALLRQTRLGELPSPYKLVEDLIDEFRQPTYLETMMAIDTFELDSTRSNAGWWLENDMLEFRSPFYDYDVMRYSLTIPPDYKLLMRVGREIWRHQFPKLGRIPYQRSGLPLTASISRIILQRLKTQVRGGSRPAGILDYDHVFRNELREWITSMLDSEDTRLRQLFEPALLHETTEAHLDDVADNSLKLGLLLTCEQVLRLTEEW